MIGAMFNFDGRKGRDEESANRPRQWIWAAKESSATIALVAILGVSLFCAFLLVRVRSGNILEQHQAILDQQQAVQNASALINKVAGQGLSYYLVNRTITRYYFYEDEASKKNGYMVLSFQPEIQQDGSWILNGLQIYRPGKSIELQETFMVADDLSWYDHSTTIRDLTLGRTVVKELKYKEGLLQGAYTASGSDGTSSLPPSVASTDSTNNLIMSGLLDFFSSVATYENYSEGVILTLPKVDYLGNPKDLLHTEVLWVQPGGDPPPEVLSSTPDGRCVEVNWLQSGIFQTVFYDKDHQLVWQKDLPEPASYLRQTTRSDLLAKFPEAESVLNRVFRITIDE